MTRTGDSKRDGHDDELMSRTEPRGAHRSKILLSAILGMVLGLMVGAGACTYIVRRQSGADDSIRELAEQEVARARESEHEAVVSRTKAENEASMLRLEKQRATDTANRYRTQLEAKTKENEQLQAEVTRLTNKLNNSLVRIANPFKR